MLTKYGWSIGSHEGTLYQQQKATLTRIKTAIVDVLNELLQGLDVLNGPPQGRHLRALRAGRHQQFRLDGVTRRLEDKFSN